MNKDDRGVLIQFPKRGLEQEEKPTVLENATLPDMSILDELDKKAEELIAKLDAEYLAMPEYNNLSFLNKL